MGSNELLHLYDTTGQADFVSEKKNNPLKFNGFSKFGSKGEI